MNLLYFRKSLYPIDIRENRFGLVYAFANLKNVNASLDKLFIESCYCYVREREEEFLLFIQPMLTLIENNMFLFCEEQEQEYILNELANKILP